MSTSTQLRLLPSAVSRAQLDRLLSAPTKQIVINKFTSSFGAKPMNNSNWPNGVDLSSQSWTLRTPRTSRTNFGGYAPNSEKIPFKAWVGGIFFVCVFFGVVPFLGQIAGFVK